MAEQVEWTVVSRRRARRGKGGPPAAVGAEAGRRPDRGQQQEKEQERQKVALPAWHQANLRAGYSEEEVEREAARLRAALEERKDAMAASAFYQRLESEVRRRVRVDGEEVGKERVAALVCYGLGSVQSTTCHALWQLACLLLLREAFLPLDPPPHTPACADDGDAEAPMAETRAAASDGDAGASRAVVEVYDPAFDAVDRRLLCSLRFTVPAANDAGKRAALPPFPPSPTTQRQEDDGGDDPRNAERGGGGADHHPPSPPPPVSPKKALFFMPHCPRRLYSNLLWANWAPHALPSLVVAGNSITSYVDRALPSQRDQDPCDCLAPLLSLARETPIGWTTPAKREGQAEEGKEMERAKGTDLRALEAGASAAFMDFSVFDFPDVPPATDTEFWGGQRPPEHGGPVTDE